MPANSKNATATMGRRDFVVAGASLAMTPLLGGGVAAAQDGQQDTSLGSGQTKARAYGNTKPDAPLSLMQIERSPVGPNDVLLDVLYCGICHSDIHQARNEWSTWNPTN